jgi:sugar transferase (PEP-CTERM system associated)
MIRFFNTSFPSRTVFLGISEACLVVFAFLAAMLVRLGANDAYFMLNYEQGLPKIIIVSMTVVLCMYYFDLYDSAVISNGREVLTRVIQVLGTVSIILALIYYVYPPLQLGRGIFVFGFVFVSMLLLCWRRLFLLINSSPNLADRAVVFGDGPLARLLLGELESRPELGLRVVAHIHGAANKDSADLACSVEAEEANRIIIAMDDRRGRLPVERLLSLKSHGVQIQDGAQLYEAVTGKVPLEALRPGWLLFSDGFHASRSLVFCGRAISCLVSAVGLLLSLPLFPLIALAIKMTSPGPVFYRQKRVGRDGKVFLCCKFRSMRADAETHTGATWATDNDPRITPVGRFLRAARLDEIPQLWMVLKGDMNIIGPRPERPEFVDTLAENIPFYHLRHTIRPGVTGWAQVRYKYGNSVEDAREKLKYDLYYIKNLSVGLDLLILFHSIKIVLLGRGAR